MRDLRDYSKTRDGVSRNHALKSTRPTGSGDLQRSKSGYRFPGFALAENPGWFPALTDRTSQRTRALTVAGQRRNFTVFPSILAIAVVEFAAPSMSSHDGMKRISIPSTFIDETGRKVKTRKASRAGASHPGPLLREMATAANKKYGQCRKRNGDPGPIRTADLRFRKPTLYPTELRGHNTNSTQQFRKLPGLSFSPCQPKPPELYCYF